MQCRVFSTVEGHYQCCEGSLVPCRVFNTVGGYQLVSISIFHDYNLIHIKGTSLNKTSSVKSYCSFPPYSRGTSLVPWRDTNSFQFQFFMIIAC